MASAPRFVSLTAGSFHTCGLTSDGAAHCWGDNALGQVGDGSDRSAPSVLSLTPSPIPQPVVGGHGFVTIAAGGYTTCGIATDAETYCEGGGFNGELGVDVAKACRLHTLDYYYEYEDYDVPCTTTPIRVSLPVRLSSLAIRGYGHCGVGATAELVCWGYGWSASRLVPEARVSTAWVVGNDLCGLETSGAVACWTVRSRPSVHVVKLFGDNLTLEKIDSGGSNGCGISRDAARIVYCWGNNTYGGVGDGTTVDRNSPVPVATPRGS